MPNYVCGQLGRAAGLSVRSKKYWHAWGCTGAWWAALLGGVEGCEEVRLLRELRDGVWSTTVRKAGQRDGSSSVGDGRIRITESQNNVEGQGVGWSPLLETTNYRFSGMMGADNYWIFSDDREKTNVHGE